MSQQSVGAPTGFRLTDEQEAIRSAVREFGRNEIEPVASNYDQDEKFPLDVIQKAAKYDLLAPSIPERYEGAGMDLVSRAVVTEELCRADPGIGTAIDLWAFESTIRVLNRYGDEWLKDEWFPRIANGESAVAIAISEPAHGSNVAGIETTATKDGAEYVVNGSKMWISSGTVADAVLTLVKTDPDASHRGISLLLIPTDSEGFSAEKITGKLGIRATDTAELRFDDVRVPEKYLVGEENQGFYYFAEAMEPARVQVAAEAVGIAQAAVDAATDYAMEREQFDQRIGEFQAVQHKIAEMATKTEACRSLTYRAATLVEDEVSHAERFASMAKYFSSERAVEVADEAIQVYGGAGYVNDHPVERYYRDARITKIYEGANEIQKNIIGQDVLGL